jgi:hypothetical protein
MPSEKTEGAIENEQSRDTGKKSKKIPSGYQNPQIEEGQTTQWPKEKGQRDKQRSTKHYTEN